MGELARVEHLLMMPAMLVPMLLRVDEYTGRSGHMATWGTPAEASTRHRAWKG